MQSKQVVITPEEVRRRLAANLRRLRAERGISQERLALEAGIDRTMLSKIERKVSNPSLETLLKLSNRLEVDIVALLDPAEGRASAPASLYPALPLRHAGRVTAHEPGDPTPSASDVDDPPA